MSVDIGSGTKSDPNVVPLCDILLVLLIIFMVITPTLQKGIDVKLPEEGKGGPPPDSHIMLIIEDNLLLKINQESVDINLLENRLREIYLTRPDKTIFIRADQSTPYRDVLRIIDIVHGAGIETLGLIPEKYNTISG